MEEFLASRCGEAESIGDDEIEIEKGKRRNEEIRLVDLAELHGCDPFSFHEQNAR